MRKMLREVAFFAAAFALIGTLIGASGVWAGVDLMGKTPPEIKAAGWLNAASPPTLAGLKGKPVVVEFWATWCPPCRKSIPHIGSLHEKYAKDGLVIIGLTDEPKEKVEAFTQKTPMPYIVGYGSKTGDEYGVDSIPRAFVLGVDGKVAWTGHPLKPEFDKAIEDAVAGAKK